MPESVLEIDEKKAKIGSNLPKKNEILLKNGETLTLNGNIRNIIKLRILKVTPYSKAKYGKYYILIWDLAGRQWPCQEDSTQYKTWRMCHNAGRDLSKEYGIKWTNR